MALSLGWKANDIRESIWRGDPALVGVPQGALDAWEVDGDATHLEPYATNGKPTIVRFRSLSPDEKHVVTAPMADAENQVEGYQRSLLRCFRIGVSFDGVEEQSRGPDGERRRVTVRERGIQMMANEVVADLEIAYPGIVMFYGKLIFDSSFLTEAEKKASSQPSTPMPSSAEESTKDTTAPSASAGAATGAL